MQYFKHFSNMRHDVKVKRLISKYGIEGYGLYNLILESITEALSTESPSPDLQETCEDIATFYNGNTSKINEIASYMINQGLLSLDEVSGRIMCHKIYKFLEASQTRSEAIRVMIKNYKSGAGWKELEYTAETEASFLSETVTDKSERKEEKRTEQNRIRHAQTGLEMNQTTYDDLVKKYGQSVVDDYFERVLDYCRANGKKYKDYSSTVRNWIKKDIDSGKFKPVKSGYREIVVPEELKDKLRDCRE